MNNDVFLAGYADAEWRTEFKERIARDIVILDLYDANYPLLMEDGKAELVAQELESIEDCELVVFYLCKEWNSPYSMLQLGDAVGRGKQVIVHIGAGVSGATKIMRYCEYRGVVFVRNMDDLVENVEEYLSQSEMTKSLDLE